MHKLLIIALIVGIVFVVSKVRAECEPTLWETSEAVHEACIRGLMSDFQCSNWLPSITKMQNDQALMDDTAQALLQYQDDWNKRTVIKTLELKDKQ